MPSDDDFGGSEDGETDLDEAKGAGDDFDDFAEGEEVDDFGDFDDGFEPEEEEEESQPLRQPVALITPKFVSRQTSELQKLFTYTFHVPYDYHCFPPYPITVHRELIMFQPVLNPSELHTLDALLTATQPHLDALFPATANTATTTTTSSSPAPSRPPPPATFLADRSASLWAQLIAPPPLQPPDWVRSRIRRLFLVSLGVPVDLDEILPAAAQKKLVLPYHTASSAASNPHLARVAAAAGDGAPSTPTGTGGARGSSKRRRAGGLPEPPAFDAVVVREISGVSDAGLAAMGDEELRKHVDSLEEWIVKGKEVLAYWVRRKEAAVGEKEAFDGVIENLVRHARKVRQ